VIIAVAVNLPIEDANSVLRYQCIPSVKENAA
jgi:hypothetical protein